MLHPLVVELDDAAVAQMAVQRVLALAQPLDIVGIDLGGGRVRMDAEIAAVLHDLAHRDAGLHDVRRQAVHLDVAAVADDHVQARIEHAQALAHVVQRRVEAAILLAQLLDRAFALGDVLIGGDEAALGQRAIAHRDHRVVGHAPPHRRGVAVRDPGAGGFQDLLRAVFGGEGAVRHRPLDQLGEMRAGLALLRRQPVDLLVGGVADAQAHVAVVEGEAMRHVFQRGIQHEVLLLQRLFVLQPLGDVLVHGDPAAVGHEAGYRLHPAAVIARHQNGLRAPGPDVVDPGIAEFLPGHVRAVAARQPVVDGRAVRDTRFHDVGVEVVELQEPLVADDDAGVGVVHDEAVRHVRERMLAAFGLKLKLGLEAGEAADVVADRHPAAVGKRLQFERDDKAARKRLPGAEWLAGGDQCDPCSVERVNLTCRDIAERHAVAEHVAVARSDPDDVGRHFEQLDIPAVDQHDPVVGIVDADALFHAVERKLAQREQAVLALLAACTELVVAGRRHGISGSRWQ